MQPTSENITIAITVYKREDYIISAIESAIKQTVPVSVIVVDDCSHNIQISQEIKNNYEKKVIYYKNSTNRGLFDNWNACLEYCKTEWLSILHDDDILCPNFVSTMLSLSRKMPDKGLYFGEVNKLYDDGTIIPPAKKDSCGTINIDDSSYIDLLAQKSTLGFPGNLFNVKMVKDLGGFCKNSYFTGDWDMWFRLALNYGGAISLIPVATARCHDNTTRASSIIIRKGIKWVLDNVQIKKNIKYMQIKNGKIIAFDRKYILKNSPIPSRILFKNAHLFNKRILFYNWWLFIHSIPPNLGYFCLQKICRLFGPNAILFISKIMKSK